MRPVVFVLALIAVLASGPASAQPRLQALTPADLQAMGELLDRGLVSLIESNERGWLRQVTVATRVAASPEQVFRVIADVERYPEFLHNFSRVEVVSRQANAVGYEWDWRGVMFDFHGANSMTLYPPRRVDVTTVDGDLGLARYLVDLRPAPGGGTVLSTAIYSDPRRDNWVARQLIEANPSMLHAMNLSVGIVFTMGIKRRAGGAAVRRTCPGSTRGGSSPCCGGASSRSSRSTIEAVSDRRPSSGKWRQPPIGCDRWSRTPRAIPRSSRRWSRATWSRAPTVC